MFDFIFKRSARTAPTTAAPDRASSIMEERHASGVAKQQALAQANMLAGDEAAAEAFILQCQFADARLVAAQHIASRAVLERVRLAMRNTDRRVSKLMQSKLDGMQQQEANQQHAIRCIEQAQQLLNQPLLTPNQVVSLDRAWLSSEQGTEPLRQQFDQVRAALRDRLEAQAVLQRAVMDVLANLKKVISVSESVASAESERALALLDRAMTQHAAAAEVASLPKHLFVEFSQQHQQFKQHLAALAQHETAIAARRKVLSQWEAAEAGTLQLDVLKDEWRALPPLQDDGLAAPLQARFDAIVQSVAGAQTPAGEATLNITAEHQHERKGEQKQAHHAGFLAMLGNLEKALQDGALQMASEADKALRALDFEVSRLSPSQSAQLANARAELSRLQGWAKWGGNVSREELLKTAEALPAQPLGVLELARKVGALRERWKSLDTSAGPAGNELWHRFDNACTAAYAPAAAHFKKLAGERQDNGEKARVLIDEVRQFAASSHPGIVEGTIDWKAHAAFCMKMSQAWQKLGTIDRKDKKQIDAEFKAVMQTLLEPLAEQRNLEKAQRERLIAEAASLNPSDRSALDNMRLLQERWQVQAKSLPLERKDEQLLWQRFREACDRVFAKRKEIASAADADRKQHLQAKEALCAELDAALEAAPGTDNKELLRILRASKEAWGSIGAVPRAAEEKIEKRYKTLVAAVQKNLDERKKVAAASGFIALKAKLQLCRAVEQALVEGAAVDPLALQQSFQAAWQDLPAVMPECEPTLQARFHLGITALQANDQAFVSVLHTNAALLAKEVLHTEILLGIASPVELAQERLQMQVAVLQSSLKDGNKAVTPEMLSSRLARLCGLPASSDSSLVARFERLLQQWEHSSL